MDDTPQLQFVEVGSRENKKKPDLTWLWIVISVAVIILVAAVLVVLLLPKKPASQSVSLPGAKVTCSPGSFHAEDGSCRRGSPARLGEPCVDRSTCGGGSYCNADNRCHEGRGGMEKDPCSTDSECKLGFRCKSSRCTAVVRRSGVTSCSKVPVYRLILDRGQMQDSLHLTEDRCFPDRRPVWFGCSEPGEDTIPLFLWQHSHTGDVVWSTLATDNPVRPPDQGYAVGNGGEPILYIYRLPGPNLLPLYRLVSGVFHTSCLNSRMLADDGRTFCYNVDSNINPSPEIVGLLGYAFLQG